MRKRVFLRLVNPIFLLAILVALVIALVFLLKPLAGFDAEISGVVDLLPRTLRPMMVALSFVGAVPFLVLFACLRAAEEWRTRQKTRAYLMLASLSSLPLFFGLKQLIERSRPVTDFVQHNNLHDFSFPSGHTTGSMAVYGMAAYLLYPRLRSPFNRIVVGLMMVFIGLIGMSRVYLGAHFPTDVLGGWLVGAIVLDILIAGSGWIVRRKQIPVKTEDS